MDELLNRVRSATGPDRELDTALWLRFTPGATYKTTRAKHTATGKEWDITEARVNGGRLEEVPAFSASLDAALALVERVLPGWDCSAVRIVDAPAEGYVWPHRQSMRQHQGVGATPALALLAALLSTLIAQPASGDVGSAKLKHGEHDAP